MEKLIKHISAISIGLLFFGAVAYAQTTGVNDSVKNVQDATRAANQQVKERMEQVKERMEQVKERMEKVRQETQEKVKEIRENLRQKIDKIRDQSKRDTATRISDQFNQMNKRWTDHFSNVLDHLDTVVQKIKSRAQKAEDSGRDISLVNAAIQNAEAKIALARTAVIAQAQKTYTIDTSSITQTGTDLKEQSNLISQFREKFKAVKDQLLKDLFALRDGPMKDARIAVLDAVQTLSRIADFNDNTSTQ